MKFLNAPAFFILVKHEHTYLFNVFYALIDMELIKVATSVTVIGWDATNRFPKVRELGRSMGYGLFPNGLACIFPFCFPLWICEKNCLHWHSPL